MNSIPTLILGVLGLGTPEIIAILAVLLLLFGGTKLPSLAKGLGQSIREFKKASTEADKDDDEDDEKDDKATAKKKSTTENAKPNGAN